MGEFLKKAVQRRGDKLSVGFLGISHLMNALSKTGNDETAFRLLEQTENPSWLYSVINGATTIWERWDSYIAETDTFGEVSMNSFNHYAYGAVGEWLYKRVAGINTAEDAAGFKRIILEPTVGGSLTWARACFESPYGEILSHWEISDKYRYTCRIPPNTSAELRLFFKPTSISGDAVYKGESDGKYVYELLSGEYIMEK